MVELYKDGRICQCRPHQVDLMVKAGWSKDKPKPKKAKAAKKAVPVDRGGNPLENDDE